MNQITYATLVWLLTLVAGGSKALSQTPFAIEFDAVISEVDGVAPLSDLPFSIHIGNRIEGTLTYRSEAAAFAQLQGHPNEISILELVIDGVSIENRFNVSTTLEGGFLDLSPPPQAEPLSSVSLAYFPVTFSVPGWVGRGLDIPWTSNVLLVGDSGVLEQPSGVLELDAWNRLDIQRELTLRLGFPNTVTVTATLGDFIEIPEPSSITLVALALIRSSCMRRF